jgi:phage-related minor tail protein
MSTDFYLDHQGAGVASGRFDDRADALSGAATALVGASTCSTEQVSALVDDVIEAATGRMYAISDELSMLAKMVDDTIRVYNELDVTYSTG